MRFSPDLGPQIAYRKPSPPMPRPVLHPPGYYMPDVLIDNLLWHKVSVTRLTAMRYYSAVLGALTIYFTWLLASAILAREWQRLAAAALVALQTILAFSASTLTNDVGVAASLTAAVAWCAWMLRGPPRPRHGIGLGILFSVAVLMKATMLSLVSRDRCDAVAPVVHLSAGPPGAMGHHRVDGRASPPSSPDGGTSIWSSRPTRSSVSAPTSSPPTSTARVSRRLRRSPGTGSHASTRATGLTTTTTRSGPTTCGSTCPSSGWSSWRRIRKTDVATDPDAATTQRL